MKKIKVRVKEKHPTKDDMLKGQRVSHFRVQECSGIVYDIHNIYFDGWMYFVVFANNDVKAYMPICKV